MDLAPLLAFQLLNGIVWGLIFALIALGLSLTFGLMRLMNVAHSALYMLGAIIAATLVQSVGLGFWTSVVLSAIAVGIVGLVMDRLVLARVVDRAPAIGLLATAGLLLMMNSFALATFGSVPVSVDPPMFATIEVFGIDYPVYRLVVAAVSLTVIAATFGFLSFTRYGLWMRAMPQSRELTLLAGVSPARVGQLTVVLGSVLAGLAGALVTPIAGAYFQMGDGILAAAFMVIVVGGAGNLLGAVLVAVGLGVIRGLASAFVTPTEAEILSLLVLLPVLLLRPDGILGDRNA